MAQHNGTALATTGFHFVMYLTDDMKRARAFYESLFALKPGAVDSEHFVEYDLPDGNTFALGHNPGAPRSSCGGAMFGVANAEAAMERVQALGGKVLGRFGGDVCTTGWCADIDGNTFGVHQRK